MECAAVISLFDTGTVANIKKIWCMSTQVSDKMVWVGNKSGDFSVKSAFALDNWVHEVGDNWWKVLWKSDLHSRLKFLLWKIGHRGLPTKAKLLARGMQLLDTECVHGCGCTEDDMHLFLKCGFAKMLWFACPWSIRWDTFQLDNVLDFLFLLAKPCGRLPVHKEDESDFFLFSALILEQIWWRRNKIVHGEKVGSSEECVRGLVNMFREFKSLARDENGAGIASALEDRPNGWRSPPRGMLKINCDAAVRDDGSAIGVVVRNHFGHVLTIQTFKFETCLLEVAEWIAVYQATLLAVRESWSQVCFEGDSKAVYQSLSMADSSSIHWASDVLNRSILDLCSSFVFCSFAWVPRNCNKLAHLACQWACSHSILGSFSPKQLPSVFGFCMIQE